MKKIFVSLFIVSFLDVSAQQDSLEIVSVPTHTEIGKSVGKKLSQKIDKDGGKIISSDGRMELIIPAGVLKPKTIISITPVTNMLPSGRNNAYKLEPSGMHFSQPLQIIFHYTDKDVDSSMEAFQGITFQDDKGQWYHLKNVVIDSINKTLSGNINHFSTWTNFNLFNLVPQKARVKVGKKIHLRVEVTDPPGEEPQGGDEGEDEITWIPIPGAGYGSSKRIWAVDGIRGGNGIVGTVAVKTLISADYTAPANIPDRNPVDVSIDVNADFTFNKVTFHKLKLVSNITIIDKSYEIKVIGFNEQESPGVKIYSVDSSSCIVSLVNKTAKLQDIQNMMCAVELENHTSCKLEYLNAATCIGPVNIAGPSKIIVTPADPPSKPYVHVVIMFIRTQAVLPEFAHPGKACGGEIYMPFPLKIPAVPMALEFDAKDEEQVLMNGGDEKNGFKVIVKPVEEEDY